MNLENSQRLLSDFPRLFRLPPAYGAGEGEGAGEHFVFECGDGWIEVVHAVSRRIVAHAEEQGLYIVIHQVREEFGVLRFRMEGADAVIFRLLENAEMVSAGICEVCGAPGMLFTHGGWRVRCDLHRRLWGERND
ncbi:hypothetical protein [Dyella koreensis]|uniref:Uncharacterized protein n=1 Tax=Dyella koreensis TaxID=311235 RepID=A0ABW8K818_9GAMM